MAEEADSVQKKNARTAYQVAASLYMQENAITWSRFNIMVAASSIIITATGVAANNEANLYWLARVLPIAGLVLCLIWWMMMMRGFAYHNIWRDSASKIEEGFSDASIDTLRRANELRSRTSPRAVHYATWVIILFCALYLVALVQILR
jgi:hypothetical protein